MGDGWESYDGPIYPITSRGKPRAARKREPSIAERLIEIGLAADRFHWDGKAYATIKIGNHTETHPIRSVAFRGWLRTNHYADRGTAARGQSIEDAIEHIDTATLHESRKLQPWLRVAGVNDKIYVDLVDEGWNVVEIDKVGWRVVRPTGSPARFIRKPHMRPLARPEPGRSIHDLWKYINVSDQDAILVLGVLVAAFRPTGPYPILCLAGEQGSAKSTVARVLKRMIDPNVAPARSLSRDERDLLVACYNSWCLSFDNLSSLSDWISDAFCRISTGGGFGARTLNTNLDETVFEAMRPIILNGIPDLTRRADLADRAVALSLPRIEADDRQLEAEFWDAFERDLPLLQGAIFDGVATALARYDEVQIPDLPRMADFAKWASAAETAFGAEPGDFLNAYRENIAGQRATTIEDDLVAVGIRDLAKEAHAGAVTSPEPCEAGEWLGSPTQLLGAVNLTLGTVAETKRFPQTASAFSARLRRAAPALRSIGVYVDQWRSHGTRHCSLRYQPEHADR